ncbi:mitochondrial import inner membrane translocase subunit TIM44-2-like [Cucurbita maxima]|uniref:Mitochondrial import inner membrane translocase subunit TIM44-2-like n=1 Tax=Cucurbita maxima TaxID=3661 RepID=A0A6J1K042_CUCMA|nr:mitochondrial import inner membrane translocase subunit TIM44-2-like [Cucurbita maxima]
MAGRKLVRDLFLSRQSLFYQLTSQESSCTRSQLLLPNGYSINRRFSVFNEFSKKVKGEANKNPEFQQSVKEWKEKAEELKGVKEDLKVRTKQTTEQLYKQVDGAWSEAEATARKVSTDVKEKISAATEEVKEAFGFSHKKSSGSTRSSTDPGADAKKHGNEAPSEEAKDQHPGSTGSSETVSGKFKSSIPSTGISSAFERLKSTKLIDLTKKGYEIVKDELSGKPHKKKHLEYEPSTSPKVERSTRTDVVVLPSKQSHWSKKWEALKAKMHGHPMFKRVTGYSEPVMSKGQEIAEDIRERWETSDNPIVQKIQDINENVFQESDAATSFKEIRRRDPYFSLPDFVSEVQEAIKPVLTSYIKGDAEILKKYCSGEVIERCKAEHQAYQSQGIFFDNKILHISDVEVRETKMMGNTPIIIVAFQTQQVYCVRDAHGSIKEGGKDTIHTVYYAWAMQMLEPEEVGEGAPHAIWRVREMQQFGVQALI